MKTSKEKERVKRKEKKTKEKRKEGESRVFERRTIFPVPPAQGVLEKPIRGGDEAWYPFTLSARGSLSFELVRVDRVWYRWKRFPNRYTWNVDSFLNHSRAPLIRFTIDGDLVRREFTVGSSPGREDTFRCGQRAGEIGSSGFPAVPRAIQSRIYISGRRLPARYPLFSAMFWSRVP